MNKFLLSGIALIVWFSSCQKSQDVPTTTTPTDTTVSPTTSYMVKTLAEKITGDAVTPASNTTTTFTYDSQNRVATATTTAGVTKKYTYSAQSYTADSYDASNKLTMHELYLLNSSSLIDSAVYYGATDTTSEKYQYNNKLLVQVTQYHVVKGQSTVTKVVKATYDTNGNIVTDEEGSTQTIKYTYTPYPFTPNFGLVYQAKYRNYLIDTYTSTGSVNKTVKAAYTFDSSSRLLSETLTDVSNGAVVASRNYTY